MKTGRVTGGFDSAFVAQTLLKGGSSQLFALVRWLARLDAVFVDLAGEPVADGVAGRFGVALITQTRAENVGRLFRALFQRTFVFHALCECVVGPSMARPPTGSTGTFGSALALKAPPKRASCILGTFRLAAAGRNALVERLSGVAFTTPGAGHVGRAFGQTAFEERLGLVLAFVYRAAVREAGELAQFGLFSAVASACAAGVRWCGSAVGQRLERSLCRDVALAARDDDAEVQ